MTADFRTRPENIWCALCPPNDKHLAEELDHIIPHRGNEALYRDESNWQMVCKSCHSRKTAAESLLHTGGGV